MPETSLPCIQLWSGRRESSPRPTAWKAVTLPLSYSRSNCPAFSISEVLRCAQDLGGGLKRPPIASTWKAVTLPLSYSRPHCHFSREILRSRSGFRLRAPSFAALGFTPAKRLKLLPRKPAAGYQPLALSKTSAAKAALLCDSQRHG